MTPSVPAVRADNIALVFQEVMTAVVRLRSGRQQSTDAASFRYHMREAVKAAAQEARNRCRYAAEDVRMATLAVVGFLDESVLSSGNPIFSDYARQPLQLEFFQTQMAGEFFFDNLRQLLAMPDSTDLADVLEVHYICLLLGFKGRYSSGRTGELQSFRQDTAAKIRHIRGANGDLSPAWALPAEAASPPVPGNLTPYIVSALCSAALALILFIAFRVSLSGMVNALSSLSGGKA